MDKYHFVNVMIKAILKRLFSVLKFQKRLRKSIKIPHLDLAVHDIAMLHVVKFPYPGPLHWHLKLLATELFVQQFLQTDNTENIK